MKDPLGLHSLGGRRSLSKSVSRLQIDTSQIILVKVHEIQA
jgi:hypothetical protein